MMFRIFIGAWGIGCLLAPLLYSSEWSSFRGESGMGIHTGEMALSWQNKDILWSKEIEGEGQSSIIQAGAKIFITSAIENNLRLLHCFDKEKGDLLWKRDQK